MDMFSLFCGSKSHEGEHCNGIYDTLSVVVDTAYTMLAQGVSYSNSIFP